MQEANPDDVFYAIADPTRRAILVFLRGGPADSGTVAANFPLSWPAISKHLRVLRDVHLVVDVRAGRRRIYAVDALPLRSVAGWLHWHNSQSKKCDTMSSARCSPRRE